MVKDFAGKEINAGDLVLRVTQSSSNVSKGDVLRVVGINPVNNGVKLEGRGAYDFAGEYFAVFQKGKPMPDKVRDPHPHAEAIKAWVDGYPVQHLNAVTGEWCDYCREFKDTTLPSFYMSKQYRIKPVEPELTEKEKQIKELVLQAEELLAKAKMLEQSK